jgi:hypothetical protein
MSVDWSFRFRDTPSEESPVRWGHMAVAKDFADVTADKINLLVSSSTSDVWHTNMCNEHG